jgi:glucosamine-phosphate N-acetyltransferase
MNKITIRELKEEDIENGFLTTLDSLRNTSSLEKNKAKKIFEKINSNPDHIIAVVDLDGKIIGSTTLLIETKFIHQGGLVGHIEDVVVDKKFQGQKIGREIITYMLEFAKKRGCYKIILDCTEDVKPFYEKLGFKQIGNEMKFKYF